MPSRSTLSQCRCTLQISTQEAKVNTVHLHPSLLFFPSQFLLPPPPPPPPPPPLHLSVSPTLSVSVSVSLFSVSHRHSPSLPSLSSLCVCLLPSLSLPLILFSLFVLSAVNHGVSLLFRLFYSITYFSRHMDTCFLTPSQFIYLK